MIQVQKARNADIKDIKITRGRKNSHLNRVTHSSERNKRSLSINSHKSITQPQPKRVPRQGATSITAKYLGCYPPKSQNVVSNQSSTNHLPSLNHSSNTQQSSHRSAVNSRRSSKTRFPNNQSIQSSTTKLSFSQPRKRSNSRVAGQDPKMVLAEFYKQIESEKQQSLDMHDYRSEKDPLKMGEYAEEIFDHLKQVENKYQAPLGYMKGQTDVSERMRGILIDWLVEVHLKFKLLPETLYLTVNIIDRYLAREQVKRSNLQLVGVTAMLIASKYEEIYAPEVKDFEYITDKAYSQKQILALEQKMLTALEFCITTPSSYRFLQRYYKLANCDENAFFLSQYLLELALIDYKMLKHHPSMIAAGALFLSQKIHKVSQPWSDTLSKHSQLTENQLKPCAKDLCLLMQKERSSLEAVKKKFALSKFREVSKIKLQQSHTASQQDAQMAD